ncbi:MAG: hypothetical protein ACKVWR_01185 [Acidimicrobiales bacterium]
MGGLWARVRDAVGQRAEGRVRGDPTSSNGASSLHLFWELPGPLSQVSAVLEVVEAPTVERLYFWALQASFTGPGEAGGAGHIGLQHHAAYPGGGACNWGGYDAAGSILDGSSSALPSALGNPHTRNYRWRPGRRYRLTIEHAPRHEQPGGAVTAWLGSVTDVEAGERTEIRSLVARGRALHAPMVWSEVFARCDHPTTLVRWTELAGRTTDGAVVTPRTVTVNYQSHAQGGCANTDSFLDAHGRLCQRTNTERTTPQGARLRLG